MASAQGVAWAWDKDLPPREKLALLYLGNEHFEARALDAAALARFVGVAIHEVPNILLALEVRCLIDCNGELVEARIGR